MQFCRGVVASWVPRARSSSCVLVAMVFHAQATPQAQRMRLNWKLNCSRMPGPATCCRSRFVVSGQSVRPVAPSESSAAWVLGMRILERDRCASPHSSPIALLMGRSERSNIQRPTRPRNIKRIRKRAHQPAKYWLLHVPSFVSVNPGLHCAHVSVPSGAQVLHPLTQHSRQMPRLVSAIGSSGFSNLHASTVAPTHVKSQKTPLPMCLAKSGHSSGHRAHLSLEE
mmetsp:Transcript_33208/g.84845  ORF Transcript_33208/g.84845 Transcript_33208/m.84845 type:complete len:226 (+) Transcript_33208:788-1465(+)